MPRYLIQKRIHSLIEYAVFDESRLISFGRNGIQFSAWEVDIATAWRSKYWLVESEVESSDFNGAWKTFHQSLTTVASRIALVGQAYYMHLAQPFLIYRMDSAIAWFRHSIDRDAVPLMFDSNELNSLDALLNNRDIPQSFYLYWNDAINAFGYSSKLVLMFAALEILFQRASRTADEFYAEIEVFFGPGLKRELYGTREDRGRSGLRQRLVHGDYLSESDTKNYVLVIHQHIVRYFNNGVLRESPINEHIVAPQRHPYGNMDWWEGFIRSETAAPLRLKPVLEAFDADENNPAGYDIVPPDDRPMSISTMHAARAVLLAVASCNHTFRFPSVRFLPVSPIILSAGWPDALHLCDPLSSLVLSSGMGAD